MSDSIDFFDEAAGVGSRIIHSLGNSRAAPHVKNYLELVARIYTILVQIHDRVAEAAVYASLAQTTGEARQALQGIQQTALKDAWKAQDLCAEFRELGEKLIPVTQTAALSIGDQSIWNEFCEILEQGEGDTAYLYDEKLYDLRMLPDTEPSLDTLKRKAEDISEQLMIQKAHFDLLAKRATAIHDRL